MTDHYLSLVVKNISLHDAQNIYPAVLKKFVELQIIRDMTYNLEDGILCLHYGEAIEQYCYEVFDNTLEVEVGRNYNVFALLEGFGYLECPECKHQFDHSDMGDFEEESDNIFDRLSTVLADWQNGADNPYLRCTECARETQLENWICDPPLGLGNLRFTFRGTSIFNKSSDVFKSIPDLVQELTQCPVEETEIII